MTISIGSLIPPRLFAAGMPAVASWARDLGLDVLDLREDFAQAAQVCHAHGLGVGAVMAAGVAQALSPDDRIRAQGVQRLLAQIRTLPGAGVRILLFVLVPEDPAQPIADSLAIYRETFPTVAAELEAAGAKAAIEGWPGPAPWYPALGYTPEVWRAMFDAVPSAAIGLNYDPSHLVRLGIDYLRVLEEFKDRVYHCHGKDTALLAENQYLYGHFPPALRPSPAFSAGAWRYCIPGAGVVDWRQVAYLLEQAGYSGCISIELEDARYWGSAEHEQQGITKSYQHLAAVFK